MNPKSKEFIEIQSKWYKKLKDKGFKDAEADEYSLKNSDSSHFMRGRMGNSSSRGKPGGQDFSDYAVYYSSVEEYYRLAGQFLYSYPFKDDREKKIWELHSEGKKLREITAALKTSKFTANKDYLSKLIRTLAEKMIKQAQEESSND